MFSKVLVALYAFLLFNLIVTAHEWGHFITARKFGIRVKEFALGMGPRILKIERGETIYSLRIFPIGGFCAMQGEEGVEEPPKDQNSQVVFDPSRSFRIKPAWQKAIVMLAGIVMNFFLGVLLSIVLTSMDSRVFSTTIDGFADSYFYSDSIDKLKVGDKIVSINGYKTHVLRDIKFAAKLSSPDQCEIDVIRNGEMVKVFDDIIYTDENGSNSLSIELKAIEKNPISIVSYAFTDVGSMMRNSWNSIVKLVSGKLSIQQLSGPIGLASNVGRIASSESVLPALVKITAMATMFSIAVGVFNGMPFPALDGGRVVFLIPEIFTGKPVNAKIEQFINIVGFLLIMVLTVFIAYNDIVSFGRS